MSDKNNPLEGATRMGDSFEPTADQLNSVLGNVSPQTQRPHAQYIQAIFNQYVGLREQALADLTILLQHSVGIGDHINLGEDVKLKISEIEKYDSLVSCMDKYFAQGQASQSMKNEQENS
jgi:hypothetical protein